MARKLKPKKVATVDGGQATIDIYLDRDRLDFFARLGLEEVRAPTADECKKEAQALARRWRPEKWEQLIIVSKDIADSTEHWLGQSHITSYGLILKYWRVERAKRLDGSTLERPHELDYQAELKDARLTLSEKYIRERRAELRDCDHRFFHNTDDIELPYTDQTWTALEQIGKSLEDAAQKLNTMLSLPDAAKRLQAMGERPLLPVSEEPPAKPEERKSGWRKRRKADK